MNTTDFADDPPASAGDRTGRASSISTSCSSIASSAQSLQRKLMEERWMAMGQQQEVNVGVLSEELKSLQLEMEQLRMVKQENELKTQQILSQVDQLLNTDDIDEYAMGEESSVLEDVLLNDNQSIEDISVIHPNDDLVLDEENSKAKVNKWVRATNEHVNNMDGAMTKTKSALRDESESRGQPRQPNATTSVERPPPPPPRSAKVLAYRRMCSGDV